MQNPKYEWKIDGVIYEFQSYEPAPKSPVPSLQGSQQKRHQYKLTGISRVGDEEFDPPKTEVVQIVGTSSRWPREL